MEFTLLLVVALSLSLLGLSTALSWVVRKVRKAIHRAQEVRPQTRYYMA